MHPGGSTGLLMSFCGIKRDRPPEREDGPAKSPRDAKSVKRAHAYRALKHMQKPRARHMVRSS